MLTALAIAALAAAQVPSQPAPSPPPANPLYLYQDFARRLHEAPVVHLTASGTLLTPDEQEPLQVHRWKLAIEVWMQKGGKSRTLVRWTRDEPETQTPPESFAQVTLSDGEHTYTWFEGEPLYRREKLAEPVFIPYPLPESFAVFDGDLAKRLPPAVDGGGFVWSQELGALPTVVLLDERHPQSEPATWMSFRATSGLLAGYCVLQPDAQSGDTLRVLLKTLEFLSELPKDLPGFKPPEAMREAPPEEPTGQK
jgi:hypothetical protein